MNVTIYTDGACSGNPGKGGWCAILAALDGVTVVKEETISGGEQKTTNNRMELLAVINGLRKLKRKSSVTVVSDSKYVCDPVNQKWIDGWVRNGWRKSNNKPVLNADLWNDLYDLIQCHDVTFMWVRGHNGHPQNERCDKIASAIAQGVC